MPGRRGDPPPGHLYLRVREAAAALELGDITMVEVMGLEPTTSCLQSRCSSQLSYTPGARSKRELRAVAAETPIVGRAARDFDLRPESPGATSVGRRATGVSRRPAARSKTVAVHDRD
jgi:hypothetical protein